jgi:transglutaminase-like putative cysteine protease
MKFGLTHRILTSALATLGVLAIVLSGALPKASTVVLLVGLAAAIAATERFQQSPTARYAAAIVPSVLLGVEFLRLVSGANLLDLAVEFAAALQIVRLATRRGAMHDQQVILLALLHLVAGTVLGGGIAYGLCLFGFLVLAPGALVLSHLRREVEGNYRQGARDRTGLPVDVPRILRSRRVIGPGFLTLTCLLSLPIIAFTAILFIIFPRVGLSLLLLQPQRSTRIVGFSDSVDLAQVGTIRSDPTIVIRFRPPKTESDPPAKMILRLRGTAFDEYRGAGQWARSSMERVTLDRQGAEIALRRPADHARDSVLKVELEPLDPTVVFLPPRAVALRWTNGLDGAVHRPPPLVRGPEATYRYEAAPDRVLRYDVYVAPPEELVEEGLSARDRERYLQLPRDLPSRMRELAKTWTDGAATDADKAARIAQRLESEFRYSLDAPSGGRPNPIDDFLFRTKEGHCEFFSTAMVLLLRTVGVPARNVTGYVGGTYNRFGGFYAVRQGDAHSWVEAWVDGGGGTGTWSTFDPTPSSGAQPLADKGGFWTLLRDAFEAVSQGWDRYVVGYDLPQQISLFQRLQRSFERAKRPTGDPSIGEPSGRTRTRLMILAGVLAASAAGVYLWRRRRPSAPEEDPVAAGRARAQRIATELWLSLEEALHTRGASRPRNVPPLRFTEQLRATRGDSLAEEAFLLASRYVEARFGGVPLTPDEEKDFARRVAALRRGDEGSALRRGDESVQQGAP